MSENQWKQGADHWFFTGDPNATELQNRNAPEEAAMSTMTVRVYDFNQIEVNGDFQTQIFGTDEHNSVFVDGPNAAVRDIAVELRGGTLCIYQTNSTPIKTMKKVIVRIGIRQLKKLVQRGNGSIEAIQIKSNHLIIDSSGGGNIYLMGQVNLKTISQAGSGSINVFGVYASHLTIVTANQGGPVNVSGNINIRSIIHRGARDINIIGANSNGLNIYAEGSGKISVLGRANLCKVTLKDAVCVFVASVHSRRVDAQLSDHVTLGLSGFVKDFYATTSGTSFLGARFLCAEQVFATAYDQSHINVTASKKAFAQANQGSSIYFFGPASLLSSFTSGKAVVLAMNERNLCNAHSEYRPYAYTYSHQGETIAYTYPSQVSHRAIHRSKIKQPASA